MAESKLPELVDIIAPWVPPPAPPPYGWIALGVGIALLVAFVVGYLLWKRSRARRSALAQLKQAEHALLQQRIEPRAAAFQAALLVCRAYRKTSLQAVQGANAAEWRDFLTALDQARFSPQTPNAQNATQLLDRARHWIRRAP